MTLIHRRTGNSQLKGVVLDWSGTTLDYGCMAPALVFIEIFGERGVAISMDEARAPMGTYKLDHIRQIMAMPAVAARWQIVHSRPPTEDDARALFEAFTPRQIAVVAQHSALIPGVGATIAAYRQRGLKIGSCTGYSRAMMEPLLPLARQQGYEPDALVCPEDVPAGRPAPWMCFANAIQLNIYPMAALVKIGDTVPDILEGLNAGMWTIGLAKTGNELGLTAAEANALPQAELHARLEAIAQRLYEAGAHYVVDGLADTLPVLDHIQTRLARGEKP